MSCWIPGTAPNASGERHASAGFLITTGLKSNRWLRVEDPTAPQGWRWQKLSDYTAQLSNSDYRQLKWPKGDDERVCACGEHTGAQTLLLPGRDRAPVVGCPALAGPLLGLQRSGS